jgi:hypothetical protein
MFRRLGLLLALALAAPIGCASPAEDEAEEQDGQLGLVPVASQIKVGAYFVDGSNNHPEQNSIIYQLTSRLDYSVVSWTQYFDGPDLACLECTRITEDVARAICDDLREQRITSWVVFGYSRGAFIANKASTLAKRRCGLQTPPSRGGKSDMVMLDQYLYGGFVDAVMMSRYLSDANWIPTNTRFHHLHRQDVDSLTVLPVTMFGGGVGKNEAGPDVEHVDMGFNPEVMAKVMTEANARAGMKIFRR